MFKILPLSKLYSLHALHTALGFRVTHPSNNALGLSPLAVVEPKFMCIVLYLIHNNIDPIGVYLGLTVWPNSSLKRLVQFKFGPSRSIIIIGRAEPPHRRSLRPTT
jgi:hypothetical protein